MMQTLWQKISSIPSSSLTASRDGGCYHREFSRHPYSGLLSSDDVEDELLHDIESSAFPSRRSRGPWHVSLRRLCWFPIRLCLRRTAFIRQLCAQLGIVLVGLIAILLLFTFAFNPSYAPAQYPANYKVVAESVRLGGGRNPDCFWRQPLSEGGKRTVGGRGNPKGEKVFIAANIVDAGLISGAWGEGVLELMDMLGEENVFLSIFENDSGPASTAALSALSTTITTHLPLANHSILSTTLPLTTLPRVLTPSGQNFTKRITYLSAVRNHALLPLLQTLPSTAINTTFELPPLSLTPQPALPTEYISHPQSFTKLLFLNDVIFDPEQILHLLFSTNGGDYAAACGMDFVNPFKYYDTFATRDTEGWGMGVPFFPWFVPGASRGAVLAGKDAVPVKSCWGGVAAFDAHLFTTSEAANYGGADQTTPKPAARLPLRFRSERSPLWDASECCIIHADIAQPARTFMNPFVRVAYDSRTFSWLWVVRRVERAFTGAHAVVVRLLGMPWGGEMRGMGAGWCGSRKLLVMKADGGWERLAAEEGEVVLS